MHMHACINTAYNQRLGVKVDFNAVVSQQNSYDNQQQ